MLALVLRKSNGSTKEESLEQSKLIVAVESEFHEPSLVGLDVIQTLAYSQRKRMGNRTIQIRHWCRNISDVTSNSIRIQGVLSCTHI